MQRRSGRNLFRPSHLIAAAGIAVVATVALAQAQGTSVTKDVVFARKTLMNSVMDEMDRIGSMVSTRQFNLPDARERADRISVMLLAFPHLFPKNSNQWKENADMDPATDTSASPDIWTDFADFYRRATAASDTAHELSRADSEDEVKRLYRALGNSCDTCHSLYLKE